MKTRDLIGRLNWFYSLELQQVDLYTAQAHAVKEHDYLAKALGRVSAIEQQHVDNIAAEIRRLGEEPSRLGDIAGPLMGKTAGLLTGAFGPHIFLKANILLEKKAMKDYKDLIRKVPGDEKLLQTLWDNLMDEDLHTAWFANKLKQLKGEQ